MPEQLVAKIKRTGYWRINIRPKKALEGRMTFEACRELVERNRVSLRGWDFPHINRQDSEHSGILRQDDFVEHWIEWDMFREFWRMYKSGQFISYKALVRDVLAGEAYFQGQKELHIIDAIYSVTEFTEFAFRMVNSRALGSQVLIYISLNNNANRSLVAGENRIPFFEANVSATETIALSGEVSMGGAEDDARSLSRHMLLELFDHFGWNPSEDRIREEQERYYRREF